MSHTQSINEVSETDVLKVACDWMNLGHRVALATVVKTWGSSPRAAGSQLVVRDDAHFVGSVSGGCVESQVVDAALTVMDSEKPELLEFGVSNEEAWGVGLACGGTVQILLDSVQEKLGLLQELLAARASRTPLVLATRLQDGVQRLLYPAQVSGEESQIVGQVLRADACFVGEASHEVFYQPFNPPLRLVAVGAVHIAQSLVVMASLCGFDVTVVDPRIAFATPARFPGVRLVTKWPAEALNALVLDSRSAVVTLTHDPKLDDPSLRMALESDAFYIGSLGSKRTHAARRQRLAADGVAAHAIDRIHGPVGLAIGARSPAEIAVAIMAQIVETLRVKS